MSAPSPSESLSRVCSGDLKEKPCQSQCKITRTELNQILELEDTNPKRFQRLYKNYFNSADRCLVCDHEICRHPSTPFSSPSTAPPAFSPYQFLFQGPSSPLLALFLWDSDEQKLIEFPTSLAGLREASLKAFEKELNSEEVKLDFYYYEIQIGGTRSKKTKISSESVFIYFRSHAHLSNDRLYVWPRNDDRSPPTSPLVFRPRPIDVSQAKQPAPVGVFLSPSPVTESPVSADRDTQMRKICEKRDLNPETKKPWCVFCGESPGVALLIACHLVPNSWNERSGLPYPELIGHTESGFNGVFGCDQCHKLWDSYRFVACLQSNGDLLIEIDSSVEEEFPRLAKLKGQRVRRPQPLDESKEEKTRARLFPPDEAWEWRLKWYRVKQLKRKENERKQQRKEEKSKRKELEKAERALQKLAFHPGHCAKCKKDDSNKTCTNPEGKLCAPCCRISRPDSTWLCRARPHRK